MKRRTPGRLHSVLTGGQAFDDTRKGLEGSLATHQAPVVVWINEYFGPVERDGYDFTDSTLYEQNADRINGMIRLEKANHDTFGKDLELMQQRKLTFAEALEAEQFGIMSRQRLKMTRDAIFAQMAAVGL